MPDTPELIIVGRLRKAHGVRGDLVVEPITDEPAEVFAAGRRLFAGTVDGDPSPDGRTLEVVSAHKLGAGGWRIHLRGIEDRNAADLWRDRYLLAPRSELKPPAEGQVYAHELVGMRVELASGEQLGRVTDWYELPQGFVLDVAIGDRTVTLPFQQEFVTTVDRDARRIVMQLPEGMLE